MATANAKRMVANEQFLAWCAEQNVLPYIGETGIPNTDARWIPDWDYYYARANAANAWVTAWAAGSWWGTYPLALYVGSTSTSIVGPVERNLQTASYKRGVNVSQGEFGVGGTFSNTNPGTFNTAYTYPSLADLQYMFTAGVRTIRLPFRWERLQNIAASNNEALVSAEVTRITNCLDDCVTAGIGVIIEPHNYARYFYDDSGLIRELVLRPSRGLSLSTNRLGMEYFRNFWRRFVAAFGSHAAIVAWDLMNEPHDMDTGRYGSFGVLAADSAAARTRVRDNGGTHVHIIAYWDRLQTTAGGALVGAEVTALTDAIADARAKDLKITWEMGIQYPPAFVLTGVQAFKNQSGTEHRPGDTTASNASGDNVRDWFWTATGRTYVADFITKVWAAITPSQIDSVRIGGGVLNELQMPWVGSTPFSWWTYGAAQQSGTDLASGMTQLPVALRSPWVPYAGGNSAGDNDTYRDYLLNNIRTFMLWLIALHKPAGFTGLIYVMHPSWGLRSDVTAVDNVYREAIAQGQDWDRYIVAYQNDPQVWPWSTWIDGTDFGSAPFADSAKAAWRKLLEVAQARNKATYIWGENTAINSANSVMDRVFQTDAVPAGYRGVFWLNDAGLNDGSTDTYANYLARVQEYDTGSAPGGSFSGTNRYTWDATLQGWVGGDGTTTPTRVTSPAPHDGAGIMRLVKTGMTAGYGNIRADDAAQMLGSASGDTLRMWVQLASGTTGTWQARPEWQNGSFAWQAGDWTTLVAGSWVEVKYTWAAGLAGARAFGLQVESNNGPGGTVTVYIDSFAQGSMAGVVSGGLNSAAHMCEVVMQETLNTIRYAGDTKPIMVPGYQWSSARYWRDNHPTRWIVDPANNYRYEAHHYFDSDFSGTYNDSWATMQAIAIAAGFSDDEGTPVGGDLAPPIISAIAATAATPTGAVVVWNTNEPADSQVEYGFTSGYGASTALSSALLTSHSQGLSGLLPGTTYHYRVLSRDAAGNLATSGDFLLQTQPASGEIAPAMTFSMGAGVAR